MSNVINQIDISQIQTLIDKIKKENDISEVQIIAPQKYEKVLKTSFPDESIYCIGTNNVFPLSDNIVICPKRTLANPVIFRWD